MSGTNGKPLVTRLTCLWLLIDGQDNTVLISSLKIWNTRQHSVQIILFNMHNPFQNLICATGEDTYITSL